MSEVISALEKIAHDEVVNNTLAVLIRSSEVNDVQYGNNIEATVKLATAINN